MTVAEIEGKKLAERYALVRSKPSDMVDHVPRLRALAAQCEHVTEFGVRGGISTTALLAGQPKKLVCVDIRPCPIIDELQACRGQTELSFIQCDSRLLTIEITDMLFIDTWHSADVLAVELERHSPRVQKWIVLHDTETYGLNGENTNRKPDSAVRGLWYAIEPFVDEGDFYVRQHYRTCWGLTILERRVRHK